MILSCCHPSSDHYGKLQGMTAVGAVALTGGTIATALIPAVYAVTTLALPVMLGVGALTAWIVLLALSINRCTFQPNLQEEKRSTLQVSPQTPSLASGEEETVEAKRHLFATCMREKDIFLKSIEPDLEVDDYKMFITAAALAFEAVQECACGVEDEHLLNEIHSAFQFEIKNFRQIAQALKEGKREEPKVKDFEVFTQLHGLYSVLRNKGEITKSNLLHFKQLIGNLGDINRSFNYIGDNPLMLLAKYGYPIEFVDILVESGANFDYQETFYGNTALIWAIANANNHMALEIIKKRKQNFDICDKGSGNTALILAISKGYETHSSDGKHLKISNLQLVSALLEHGASPNVKDKAGTSPLMLAVMRRDPEMVKALLDAGAIVDFDYKQLLKLSYKAVSERLKSQACVYTLNRKKFDSSKEAVSSLLSN